MEEGGITLNKNIPVIGIIFLFILGSLAPMTFGYKITIPTEKEQLSSKSDGGLMDSAWPMYCHDNRHTGRSPYSTVDTWNEIWKFKTHGSADGGPVIAEDGIIYIGAFRLYAIYSNGTEKWNYDVDGWIMSCPAVDENGIIYIGTKGGDVNYMYAINPDGTVKWKYPTSDIYSSPAIGNNGTIFFADSDNWYIKALFPNGTLKWSYKTNHVVYSSPAIGDDGTVYCGCHDNYLYALYPNNGTLKWKYKTGHWIRTSPCIGDDGSIYVVSLDNYLHAVNPNGTLKWKTDVGAGTTPTIGQDGTIYAGYRTLHAVNPINGSVKWKFDVGGAMRGGTPCNSIDGTIYVGTHIGSFDDGEIIAISSDGNLKFRKKIKTVESPPAIGEDGTVYIGSWDGPLNGYLHAFGIGKLKADADGPYYGLVSNPVQFEGKAMGGYSPHSYQWDFGDTHASEEQNPIHIYTSPGNYTVSFTVTDNTSNTSSDTTWAWIQTSNEPPDKPNIDGQAHGIVGVSYDYTFNAIDPDENDIWYHICWGDEEIIYIYGPYQSGKEITLPYTWSEKGIFTITSWARDVYDEVSETAILEVTMPRNRIATNNIIMRILEHFPILHRLLSLLRVNL